MATVGIPDVTELWQGKFETLSGSTDNMEMLQAQGQLTRVGKLVVSLDSRVMVITDFVCKKLTIQVPAALANGAGIWNVAKHAFGVGRFFQITVEG